MAKKTTQKTAKKSVKKSAVKRAAKSTPADRATEKAEPKNQSLSAARSAKKDEFYTQYVDIHKEVEAYLEFDADTFRDKIVYCNCDDPFESNFFKYFAANFNRLGLKKLICTSYDGSPLAGQMTLFDEYNAGNGHRKKPKAIAVIVDHVKDENNDGAADIEDVKLFLKKNKANRIALKGNDQYPGGDFRSPECIEYLKQADIVVTNPPFSLFREYVEQLVEYNKKLLVIGNIQAITYKEVFPLIRGDKLWMGVTIHSGDREFRVPDHYPLNAAGYRVDENGVKYIRVKGVRWWTNLDHGRRHQQLPLMSMSDHLKFSKHKEIKGKRAYARYDNYNAIEVPYTDAIPSDYDGAMGVPITFLDKYSPEQFEILSSNDIRKNSTVPYKQHGLIKDKDSAINGKPVYVRIVIRHRKPAKGKK